MSTIQKLHYGTFILGSLIFLLSLISAIFLSYPHFYTWFALGGWLILDGIDYYLNKTSILGYFYNHKHRKTFFIFFFVSTIIAFFIDYIYGVRLSNMWTWRAYSDIHFIRMYTIMNVAYILSMYELFRVIHTILKPFINEKHTFIFKIKNGYKKYINYSGILIGIIFLIIPFITWKFNKVNYMPYIMLLPFLGMWSISDSISLLYNGKAIFNEIIRGNKLYISSIFFTVLSASFFTEIINLNAHEWIYNYMPFENIQVFNIPIAVFIGWTPLVIGVISLVNMIKYIDYYVKKI